jgi:hypothetical protein
MRHRTTAQFRQRYQALPQVVRDQADKSFALLKANPLLKTKR